MIRATSAICALSLSMAISSCAPAGIRFPPAPAGMTSVSNTDVMQWVTETRSIGPKPDSITFNFRFTGRTVDGVLPGKGTIQIAKPDSLRLDFWGAFGGNRGGAFVLGDTAIWAVPKDKVQELVPSYPLLWAMVGQARPPRAGATVQGVNTESSAWWRYLSGADTVTYVLNHRGARQLSVRVVLAGKEVGQVSTMFDVNGMLVKSTLLLPKGAGKLELTFKRVTRPDSIAKDLWRAPSDSL